MDDHSHIKIKLGNLEFEVNGSEGFVDQQFAHLRALIPGGTIPQQITTVEEAVTAPVPEEAQEQKTAATVNGTVPSLLDFYRTRTPKTDIERVTVVAAYAQDHRQQTEVSEEVLRPYFNELAAQKQAIPKNIRTAIWNASAKARGYLERVKGKRNAFRLTTAGVVLVHTELPKRGQVGAE